MDHLKIVGRGQPGLQLPQWGHLEWGHLHGGNNDLFYEKELKANGLIEHKHFLSAGGITFAIQTLREGVLNGKPQRTLNYLHADHLGSTAAVTDEAGR
jgi:hypothetical protein